MGGDLFSTPEVGLWPFCYYNSFCWPIFHWPALIAVVIPRFMDFFILTNVSTVCLSSSLMDCLTASV